MPSYLAYLRSGLVLIVALMAAVGVTTLPIRAADESKDFQSRIRKLERGLEKTQANLAATQADLASSMLEVQTLQAKLQYVSVVQDPINGLAGPHVIFEGCNVHVRSGSGDTVDGTVNLVNWTTIPDTTSVGLGNLIVGYNEEPMLVPADRGGSHNVVVGPGHNYPTVGGVAFGQENSATGPLASVTAGYRNEASGYASSVSGGGTNAAESLLSSVSGGGSNTASSFEASVSGGNSNTASGQSTCVSGGSNNTASASYASVSGGNTNTASGDSSSIGGGYTRSATGSYDWVAGTLFQDF